MYIGLTSNQIIKIHDLQIKEHGGLPGIKEPGYLELLADKPFTDYYGTEQYPGLFLKAAVYFEGIATAHVFNDGNKRTAVLVTYTFLSLNGYDLECDWEELFHLSIEVAQGRVPIDNLSVWLEGHCVRL